MDSSERELTSREAVIALIIMHVAPEQRQLARKEAEKALERDPNSETDRIMIEMIDYVDRMKGPTP